MGGYFSSVKEETISSLMSKGSIMKAHTFISVLLDDLSEGKRQGIGTCRDMNEAQHNCRRLARVEYKGAW